MGLTLKLADIALNNSIKRFIFMSSIGIHGDQSILGSPINELSKIILIIFIQSQKLRLRKVYIKVLEMGVVIFV